MTRHRTPPPAPPTLFTLVMLSKDVSYEDGDAGIDDFEVFSSVEKAKQFAYHVELAMFTEASPDDTEFKPITWQDHQDGRGAESGDFDSSYNGYTYVIRPVDVDPLHHTLVQDANPVVD